MDLDAGSRARLLRQVKSGRQTGATHWTRLFIIVVSAAEMVNVVLDVQRGRGTFTLLSSAIVMVFIVAMAAIGLGILDTNERFASLIALIGEEKLLHGGE